MAEKDDIVAEAKEAFECAQDCESDNRAEALDDLRFVKLLEQWPDAVRKQRMLEGRPCLTIDTLGPVVRQVLNDARQNKPSIVTHPVDDDADPETAEIFNGLIRNIEQSSDADVAYDTALDYAVSCGTGYFKINTQYVHDKGFEQDIVIERVANPFSIYGDPSSDAADSSDWNVAFELEAFTTEQFESRWDKAEPTSFTDAGLNGYVRQKGETVIVASYWTREETVRKVVALSNGELMDLDTFKKNKDAFAAMQPPIEVVGRPRDIPSYKVTQRMMSGAEELEKIAWAGKYIPIIPIYGEETNIEGRRYYNSLVRPAKDAQRMFNYWRTTGTELVALAPKAPFIGRKGAFETDANKWATANSESHAFIEYDGQEMPQRQPFAGVPAGVLQEALNASEDIKRITGIYDASLGAKSNETSGKAIMARQREGDVSTFHYIDNLSRGIKHAGRILVDLIPKVYSVPRIVRTLGPQGEVSKVAVGPQADAQADPKIQQFLANQAQQQQEQADQNEQAKKIARIYDLGAGKYDVTVKVGPSFTSRREEAATQMIELIRAYPDAAPFIGDLLAKNLDWPGADEVAARLKKMLPPQLQGGNPEADAVKMQAQQAIAAGAQQLQQLQVENEQLKQQVASDQERNAIEAHKVEVASFEAQTRRMSVEQAPLLAQQKTVQKAVEPAF